MQAKIFGGIRKEIDRGIMKEMAVAVNGKGFLIKKLFYTCEIYTAELNYDAMQHFHQDKMA